MSYCGIASNGPWNHHSLITTANSKFPALEAQIFGNELLTALVYGGNSSSDAGDEQASGKQAEEIKLLLYPCIVARKCAGLRGKEPPFTLAISLLGANETNIR